MKYKIKKLKIFILLVLSLILPINISAYSDYIIASGKSVGLEIKNNGAGELLEEKELTVEQLVNKINEVLNDEKKYNSMKENLKKISMDNSSNVIYKKLKDLIKW